MHTTEPARQSSPEERTLVAELAAIVAAARALLLHPAVPTGTDEWHILARLLDGEAHLQGLRRERGYE